MLEGILFIFYSLLIIFYYIYLFLFFISLAGGMHAKFGPTLARIRGNLVGSESTEVDASQVKFMGDLFAFVVAQDLDVASKFLGFLTEIITNNRMRANVAKTETRGGNQDESLNTGRAREDVCTYCKRRPRRTTTHSSA